MNQFHHQQQKQNNNHRIDILLFSDDIVTIYNNNRKSDEDEKLLSILSWDNHDVDNNIIMYNNNHINHNNHKISQDNNDDDDDDDESMSDFSSSCTISEDNSMNESDDEIIIERKDMSSTPDKTRMSTLWKIDLELTLRAALILCLYCIAHVSFYECFMTILYCLPPCRNVIFLIVGLFLLRMTGGCIWYLSLTEDRNNYFVMREKIKEMKIQKDNMLLRYWNIKNNKDDQLSLMTLFSLKIIQREKIIVSWFKKYRGVRLIVDMVAFYLIYTVWYNQIHSMESIIEIPKVDLIKNLPSSLLNITNGYHPSTIHKYLVESLREIQPREVENHFQVDNCLISKKYEIFTKPIIDHNLDVCTVQDNCHIQDDLLSSSDYLLCIKDHLLVLQELNEKWTAMDYEYISHVISPASSALFFGDYSATFASSRIYFVFHMIIVIVALLFLSKIGVPATNILD